jgi:HK97 family phage major capsid protein
MTKTITLQELRAKKKELAAEIRKQQEAYDERRKDNGEGWPDETRAAWDSINKEYDENEKLLIQATNDDEVRSRVEKMRADEEQSRRTGHKPGLDDTLPGENRTYGDMGLDRDGASELAKRQHDTRLAFRSFILAGNPELITDEMRDACERMRYRAGQETKLRLHRTQSIKAAQRQLKSMNHSQRAIALETGELRALSHATSGSGPELVPQTFVNMLEMAMLANGNMLAYFDTMTTDTGEAMNWPIADDTANEGDWVDAESEDTQTVGEPNPAFKRTSWDAHELHSKWIKVPIALNEDSMFDIEVILATMMGERLGRTINTAATSGDGTKKPRGILLDAPVGHTCASATAIAYDDIVKLEHSVDPAYRPQSQYAMHDSVLETLRLLKDSEGRPLWQVSMRDGTPDRLHNREYAYNQAMADTIEANAQTMLFGRLSDYKLRRVGQMRILRANERFAEKLQIGFLGYIRVDGKLLRPTADGPTSVKKMAQAAS